MSLSGLNVLSFLLTLVLGGCLYVLVWERWHLKHARPVSELWGTRLVLPPRDALRLTAALLALSAVLLGRFVALPIASDNRVAEARQQAREAFFDGWQEGCRMIFSRGSTGTLYSAESAPLYLDGRKYTQFWCEQLNVEWKVSTNPFGAQLQPVDIRPETDLGSYVNDFSRMGREWAIEAAFVAAPGLCTLTESWMAAFYHYYSCREPLL
jgi:hypothetical protein